MLISKPILIFEIIIGSDKQLSVKRDIRQKFKVIINKKRKKNKEINNNNKNLTILLVLIKKKVLILIKK